MAIEPTLNSLAIAALIFVLGLGLGLRVQAIGFGLPYLYVPDEPNKVTTVLNVLETRDHSPHSVDTPTLQLHATTALYLPYYLRDSERHPARVAACQALWGSMPDAMRFTDGDCEIQLRRGQ